MTGLTATSLPSSLLFGQLDSQQTLNEYLFQARPLLKPWGRKNEQGRIPCLRETDKVTDRVWWMRGREGQSSGVRVQGRTLNQSAVE